MGVVNVTPDSFSDGGRWFEPASAIAHGLDLFAEGAAIVDVGRRVDPAGSRARRAGRGAAAGAAGDRGAGRPRADLGRHPERGRPRSPPWPRAPPSSTTSRPASTRSPPGSAWAGSPCTCRATRGRCSRPRRTTTSSARCATTSSPGPRPRGTPASTRCGSTRASASARTCATTSSCWPTSTSWWPPASRSRSGSPARRSSAACSRPATSRASAPALPGLVGVGIADDTTPVPVDDRIEGSLAAATWAAVQGVRLIRAHDVLATVHAVELVGDMALAGAA